MALITNDGMVVPVMLFFDQFVMIWMTMMNMIRMYVVHKCENASMIAVVVGRISSRLAVSYEP